MTLCNFIPSVVGILLIRGRAAAIIPVFEGITMKFAVRSAQELGLIVRAVRRSTHVRIDDLAAIAKVSKQFASDVELGKPTVQLGRVFHLLIELGIQLAVELPADAAVELARLRAKGSRRAPNQSKRPPARDA
jgi:hypothetical protein